MPIGYYLHQRRNNYITEIYWRSVNVSVRYNVENRSSTRAILTCAYMCVHVRRSSFLEWKKGARFKDTAGINEETRGAELLSSRAVISRSSRLRHSRSYACVVHTDAGAGGRSLNFQVGLGLSPSLPDVSIFRSRAGRGVQRLTAANPVSRRYRVVNSSEMTVARALRSSPNVPRKLPTRSRSSRSARAFSVTPPFSRRARLRYDKRKAAREIHSETVTWHATSLTRARFR